MLGWQTSSTYDTIDRRAQVRQPELILALFAELSSGHSPSHMSTLGSLTDQLRLAAEMISICHP